MSGLFRGPSNHDRARELAAWRMDGLLEPGEEAWLDEHLAACPDCSATAADYGTDRLLLQGLRDASLEPPRDLWARTSAALEAQGARRGGRTAKEPREASEDLGWVLGPVAGPAGAAAASGRLGWVLAPVAGVAMVAVVVGAGLLNGQPAASPIAVEAGATPMAIAANIQVLGQDEDGRLEIRTQNVREVCPIGAGTCSVQPPSAAEPLAAMVQTPVVTAAVLSPARDRLVVVQGDADGQGVYVVPVSAPDGSAAGSPVSPTAVPRETAAVTGPGPTAGGGPAASASPDTPAATDAPVATSPAAPGPSDTPSPDGSPSAEPGTETPPAATADPTVQPEPTPVVATEAPGTARPTPGVEVTPGPGGAIQIASDVVVVGPVAAYNRAGTRLAFSARPADGSTGPDVYVWNTAQSRARPVTTDHRSVFAGWHSGDLVVSRVGDDGDGATWLVDPVDGAARGPVSAGWLPVISPDQRAAVWWDGDVHFGRDGVTPRTGDGNLVLGPWERDGEIQTLVEGPLREWVAAWDPTGSVLAVWTAGRGEAEPGFLSLYRTTGSGRAVDLENPIRKDVPAFEGFVLDTDHLAWSATGDDGKRVVRVLAWNDDGVGEVEFAAEDGGTIVH